MGIKLHFLAYCLKFYIYFILFATIYKIIIYIRMNSCNWCILLDLTKNIFFKEKVYYLLPHFINI